MRFKYLQFLFFYFCLFGVAVSCDFFLTFYTKDTILPLPLMSTWLFLGVRNFTKSFLSVFVCECNNIKKETFKCRPINYVGK